MYSEESKRIWDAMTPEQRLAVLPPIRALSDAHGSTWSKSDEELSRLPYDELPPDIWWDLCMAEDGDTFSADAWDKAYEQMTTDKTG